MNNTKTTVLNFLLIYVVLYVTYDRNLEICASVIQFIK